MQITGKLKLELPPFAAIKPGQLFIHNDILYLKGHYGGVTYGMNVETGQMHQFLPESHAIPREGKIVLE